MSKLQIPDPLDKYWLAQCSEVVHPFHPHSCPVAFWIVWRDAFKFALKVYGPLFLIPAILFQRKNPKKILTRTIPSIIRSSAFLGTLGGGTIPVNCFLRNTLGRNSPMNMFIGGLTSGVASMIIEEKSRRPELAVYTMQQCCESVYRFLAVRGYVPLLEKGDIMVFVFGMSLLCYLYNYKRDSLGSVKSILKFLLGDKEDSVTVTDFTNGTSRTVSTTTTLDTDGHTSTETVTQKIQVNNNTNTNQVNSLTHTTVLCQHKEHCAIHAVRGFVRALLIGFGMRGGLSLLSNAKRLFRQPVALFQKSFGKEAAMFGLFLATLVGSWKSVLCLLRQMQGKDHPSHSLVAGAVAGLSISFWRSTEISMYFASKAVEGLYNIAVDKGYLPSYYYGDIGLYSLACGFLFYCSAMEPFNLRPSYWRFLHSASAGRYNQFEEWARAYHPELFERSGFKYTK